MSETFLLSNDSAADSAPDAAGVALERLEAQICELAGHLAAATCRFLLLVGEFDARRFWADWDLPSCAAWLAWKCQLAPGTAREHVRVARALRDLPVIRGEFAAGTMSYAKVRALTRIATAATETDLAELAAPMTGGQLQRFVRAHRQVSAACGQRALAARRVSWRLEDDGSMSMSMRLPAAEGQVVLQVLRAAANDLEHPHPVHDHDESPAATHPASPDKPSPGSRGPGPRHRPARRPAPARRQRRHHHLSRRPHHRGHHHLQLVRRPARP